MLDNARHHHAKLLKSLLERHQAHVYLELLFLPPYIQSPVGTRRAGLEAGATAGNAQSLSR